MVQVLTYDQVFYKVMVAYTEHGVPVGEAGGDVN